MKVAVTGTGGRLGSALAKAWRERGHEVIELDRSRLDLTWPEDRLRQTMAGWNFELMANPAAVTSVEAAEADPDLAWQVNAIAPGHLAAVCASRGIRMFHFSTDYVFGGQEPGFRTEDEPAEPLNVYGRTKLAGERAVLAACPAACVMRVSWLFGPERPGFPESILDLYRRGQAVHAVDDKWSIPTYTLDLVEWVCRLAENPTARGVIHACQSGEPASWHDWAKATLQWVGGDPAGILSSPAGSHVGFRARRPVHSAMDNARLAALLGWPPRSWRDALAAHLAATISGCQTSGCQTV